MIQSRDCQLQGSFNPHLTTAARRTRRDRKICPWSRQIPPRNLLKMTRIATSGGFGLASINSIKFTLARPKPPEVAIFGLNATIFSHLIQFWPYECKFYKNLHSQCQDCIFGQFRSKFTILINLGLMRVNFYKIYTRETKTTGFGLIRSKRCNFLTVTPPCGQ